MALRIRDLREDHIPNRNTPDSKVIEIGCIF